MKRVKVPNTFVIIFAVILFCAFLTWILPGGQYIDDGNGKMVFNPVESVPQTWQILSSMFKGFVQQAEIIAFVLIIGGSFWVVNSTGAVDAGIRSFIRHTSTLESRPFFRKVGVGNIVIVLLMCLFGVFGAVFGMSEETIAFTAIVIPLAISLGYDSITGVCMVYVAAHVGFAGAMLNPFTIGIAQKMADIPLFSGIGYRTFCWAILMVIAIIFVLIYANRVKSNPRLSPMYEEDSHWRERSEEAEAMEDDGKKRSRVVVLILLFATIVALLVGVLKYKWYITEIASLFLGLAILSGIVSGYSPDRFAKSFVEGAKDIFSAALVIGVAAGIIVVLRDGMIIDTILHGLSAALDGSGKVAALGSMYGIQTLINLFIPSASAKAAITMPIMAPFSDLIGVSRQATVLAFQFGDGFTNMITPCSGVLLAVLSVARIPFAKWVKWVWKFILLLIVIGFLLLLPTIYFNFQGF